MIPKILHNIWLGDKKIPAEFIEYHNNWKILHPEWDYKLWENKDLIDIDPDIKNLIDNTKIFSSKSNILRIYIIYVYGGIYADMDMDWNKSLNPLLNNLSFMPKSTLNTYCNAIFGSIKNHEWFKLMIDSLKDFVNDPPPWGPELTKKTFLQIMDKNIVTLLPRKSFYPYLWNEIPQPTKNFPNSYGVHHWNKSWKKEI
jgi:mannosyltransferase OCH1-like enzyme